MLHQISKDSTNPKDNFFKTTVMKIFLLVLACFCSLTGFSAPKAKRVVLIALDGISVEGFQKANTPNLDALLKEGVLSIQTRVVMPSVTLPNWTSHLTGSGPEQHGIVDNGWEINKRSSRLSKQMPMVIIRQYSKY